MSRASGDALGRGIEEIPEPAPELCAADPTPWHRRRGYPQRFGVWFRDVHDAPETAIRDDRVMSTHIYGLTVAALADASRAARVVDHAVTLVDESSHVIVVVDQRGRVTMRTAAR
jgi:hypothetical protein